MDNIWRICIGKKHITILIFIFLGSMISEGVKGPSEDPFNQGTSEREPDILINLSNETPIELEGGYKLDVQSVDIDGNKVYVELFKDGYVVDSRIIIAANEGDGTYIYLDPETGQKLEIHFKNAFRSPSDRLAAIDRVSQ